MPSPDKKDLLLYRQKNFEVMVDAPLSESEIDGEISLSITHNGRQWQFITLSPNEALQVMAALSEHLATVAKPILQAAEFKE